ncbi:hypothetical protein FHL81_10820 [Agrobacterium tumefaciens]|uniref:hypothetical protein n=1 Tax=Agrobacterium tumefaciens TaxID=358 RepID=UPI0011F0E40E|nr:hypothetical protein [Agrobacterium tumefaciens]KAA1237123.1 hypothetical protein FHL81_10820 [Agrobacterium tumefaciens]
MVEKIFAESRRQQAIAEIEFRHFKELAIVEIEKLKAKNPRFEALEAYYGFYVDNKDENRLQIWFGTRSMFRKDYEGKAAATEKGATLLYSLGAMGDVATILYPAESTFGKAEEDFIFRGIGRLSGANLLRNLKKRDFDDLIAYAYVSSIEAQAMSRESRRIWWLRLISAMRIGDKHEPPKIKAYMGGAGKSLVMAFLMALMRPIALLLVTAVVLWFGWDALIEVLKGKA